MTDKTNERLEAKPSTYFIEKMADIERATLMSIIFDGENSIYSDYYISYQPAPSSLLNPLPSFCQNFIRISSPGNLCWTTIM